MEGRGVKMFPKYYSVIVSGPPGVGKQDFCMRLANKFLENGDIVIVVTTEQPPEDILEELGENENLYIFDMFSWSVGCFFLSERVKRINPNYLSEILYEIGKIVKEAKKPVRVIFTSLSSLFSPLFQYEKDYLIRFFQMLTANMKNRYGFILYTFHEGVHEPRLINTLLSMVDGYIQLRFLETEKEIKRQFRIHHLKGIKGISHEWIDLRAIDIFLEVESHEEKQGIQVKNNINKEFI